MTQRIDFDSWQPQDDVEVVVTHDHPAETEQSTTIIKANADGIIIDFYLDGELTGTIGMTYEEWFDHSQKWITQ